MRIFTLICSLLLLSVGAAAYFGWGVSGEGTGTLISAIPAGFGALMLLGVALALLLRRSGMEVAWLAALAGGFSGLGRLAPPYLKGSLDGTAYPIPHVTAMVVVCLAYIIVRLITAALPTRSKPKPCTVETPEDKAELKPC